MIDATKCEFEEGFRDEDLECTVYYFVYPRAMTELPFEPEENYGNVVSMCLSLTVYDFGGYSLMLSPTVEDEYGMTDVDWRYLEHGENYTEDTVNKLLSMVEGKHIWK